MGKAENLLLWTNVFLTKLGLIFNMVQDFNNLWKIHSIYQLEGAKFSDKICAWIDMLKIIIKILTKH